VILNSASVSAKAPWESGEMGYLVMVASQAYHPLTKVVKDSYS
jgi:hypothetical protein